MNYEFQQSHKGTKYNENALLTHLHRKNKVPKHDLLDDDSHDGIIFVIAMLVAVGENKRQSVASLYHVAPPR